MAGGRVSASWRGSPKTWAIVSAIQWSNPEPMPVWTRGAVAAMVNGPAEAEAMGTCGKGFSSLLTCGTLGNR